MVLHSVILLQSSNRPLNIQICSSQSRILRPASRYIQNLAVLLFGICRTAVYKDEKLFTNDDIERETMEYRKLEETIRADAAKTATENRTWSAVEVSQLLQQIADELTRIRREHHSGIDASMGKRSGLNKVDI